MIRFLAGYTSSVPLNHPRICYESYAATVTGTAGKTYNGDVVTNEYTYERWDGADPLMECGDPEGECGSEGWGIVGALTLDFINAKPLSYVAVAAHTLKDYHITLEWSLDGVTYTELHSGVETSDNPLIFVFTEVTARYVRFSAYGGEVGVIYCGRILELQRGIYAGHTPITLSRTTVKNLNRSVKGQFLGTSIVRTGLSSSYQASNIPIDWYETNIEPLSLHARTKPFFVAWNPLEHPTHTVYGYAQGDIKPTLSGVINMCEFSFDLDGYVTV